MPNLRTRLITVPLASIMLAIGGAALAASTASAAEEPHPTFTPVENVGEAVEYGTHQVQMHLDAPMLGLNPAIANPVGYTSTHVLPVGINVVSFVTTGDTVVDDGTGHEHH